MKTLISRRVATAVGAASLVLLAAGCASGSSSSAASNSTPTASASARSSVSPQGASAPAAATAAVLKTGQTKFGTVLTDAKGLTVYWFAKDTPGGSACTGACAAAWPPVTGTPQAASGVTLTGKLGQIKRPDGTVQATYKGHPLYTFQGDSAPGQANGNGLTGFGAKWSVIRVTSKASAAVSTAPSSTPATPAASPSSTGGYGY